MAVSRGSSPAILVATIALLSIGACHEDTNSGPPEIPPQTVNQAVEETGWFPEFVSDSTAFTQSRFDSSAVDGASMLCGDYIGQQTEEVSTLTIFAADPLLHYAGSILQYASLGDAVPQAVLASRAGGSLELVTADGSVVAGDVDAVEGAEVEAWRRGAVEQANAAASGPWRLSAGVVRGEQLIALTARVNPPALPAEAVAALVPRDGDLGRVAICLRRTHHTVSCDYPGRAGDAFTDDVLGVDIADQMAEGNPPVWVDSVAYGETVLLLIEAAAPHDEVFAAAVATFSAAATGSDPDAGSTALSDLSDLSVEAFGVGTDADEIASAAATGLAQLRDALEADPVDPVSLPAVDATLLALRNGGPVTIAIEGQFAFTTCEPYTAVFDHVLWALDANDARTERRWCDLQSNGEGRFYYNGGVYEYEYSHVTYLPDLRGQGGVARPSPGSRDPIVWYDMAGGRPAIELYELGLPDGHIYSQLEFNGSSLVGQPYTLFVVVGMPERVFLTVVTDQDPLNISRQNQVNWFLHGDDNGTRRNLAIGYPATDLMAWSHSLSGIEFFHRRPVGWHVYAFRFSTNLGMTAWMDGELLYHNQYANYSLQLFEGATICTRWHGLHGFGHAALWFAEAIAYQGDGDEDEVLAEIARLMEKYGI